MSLRKLVRESAFHIARRDVAVFLQEHEQDLIQVFREEMQILDDEIPEESMFIDIKMVPLGEAIMKSALHAITRFLMDDYDRPEDSEGKASASAKAGKVAEIERQ